MTAATAPRRRFGVGFWGFIVFMLALTALFVVLGIWQVERLGWKEQLIADVNARLTLPPAPLPALDQWPSVDPDALQFRPLEATGHYLPERTVPVFTSLSEPRGRYSGPGYWLMMPFAVDGGGTLFVNRGFVPQEQLDGFAGGTGVATDTQTISGVAVAPESAGMFTPAPDTARRVDWIRNPARLAAMAAIDGPVFAMTLDLPAAGQGTLPQGGETVVEFPNNHLGYALTWFGFAILTPALLAFWIWRQVRPAAA